MYIVWVCDQMTLLVHWNPIDIDEYYQVMRIEGGSYGYVRVLEYELIGIGHMGLTLCIWNCI